MQICIAATHDKKPKTTHVWTSNGLYEDIMLVIYLLIMD